MMIEYKKQENRASKAVRLAKKILKGRLSKTSRVTLNLSTNMLDLRQELSQWLAHWTTKEI